LRAMRLGLHESGALSCSRARARGRPPGPSGQDLRRIRRETKYFPTRDRRAPIPEMGSQFTTTRGVSRRGRETTLFLTRETPSRSEVLIPRAFRITSSKELPAFDMNISRQFRGDLWLARTSKDDLKAEAPVARGCPSVDLRRTRRGRRNSQTRSPGRADQRDPGGRFECFDHSSAQQDLDFLSGAVFIEGGKRMRRKKKNGHRGTTPPCAMGPPAARGVLSFSHRTGAWQGAGGADRSPTHTYYTQRSKTSLTRRTIGADPRPGPPMNQGRSSAPSSRGFAPIGDRLRQGGDVHQKNRTSEAPRCHCTSQPDSPSTKRGVKEGTYPKGCDFGQGRGAQAKAKIFARQGRNTGPPTPKTRNTVNPPDLVTRRRALQAHHLNLRGVGKNRGAPARA